MKFVIAFAILFTVAAAYPQRASDAQAAIVSQNQEISPDQTQYSHSVETSNGISQKETGRLIQPKSSDASPAYVAEGEYQFLGQDNVLYKVRYTADEFGFHPQGDHLPRAQA